VTVPGPVFGAPAACSVVIGGKRDVVMAAWGVEGDALNLVASPDPDAAIDGPALTVDGTLYMGDTGGYNDMAIVITDTSAGFWGGAPVQEGVIDIWTHVNSR
jgi:hypothetical protein